jgi:hypothetical protein
VVGLKKVPATQALALSGSRDGRSSDRVEQATPSAARDAQPPRTEIKREEDASETLVGRRRNPKKMHVHPDGINALSSRWPHPRTPFASLASASAWIGRFTVWYIDEHRHSGIG